MKPLEAIDKHTVASNLCAEKREPYKWCEINCYLDTHVKRSMVWTFRVTFTKAPTVGRSQTVY